MNTSDVKSGISLMSMSTSDVKSKTMDNEHGMAFYDRSMPNTESIHHDLSSQPHVLGSHGLLIVHISTVFDTFSRSLHRFVSGQPDMCSIMARVQSKR